MEIRSRNRRRILSKALRFRHTRAFGLLAVVALGTSALAQTDAGRKITLEEAVKIALERNHILLASRTTIMQNQALEVQANLRPNPSIFVDWEYLPFFTRAPGQSVAEYLQTSTEGDIGLSYLFERGQKRQHRLEAARDTTAVSRATVTDNERTLTFQVAQLYINAQLADATLDLARQDLKSFQTTADISEHQYQVGGISENDYLQIKLQLVQFQQDVEQAVLAKAQALSDLRQQLGYESLPADYDIAEALEYRPVSAKLEELQQKALENRPDLRAATLTVTAAKSQHELAKANGKQDVTVSANYSHVNGINAATWSVSVPLPIFDRNQGTIAQTRVAVRQAQEQLQATNGQALTDVRDAYEGLQSSDRVVKIFTEGARQTALKSRDISDYAYHRGAIALLDFLNAERQYRATELAYRQALAAYVTSLEQLREAVGSRSLL